MHGALEQHTVMHHKAASFDRIKASEAGCAEIRGVEVRFKIVNELVIIEGPIHEQLENLTSTQPISENPFLHSTSTEHLLVRWMRAATG
eukprot:1139355-Pelagomonas_calceolata.AAC.5